MKEKIINTANFLKDNIITFVFFYKKGVIKLPHDVRDEISQKIRDDLTSENIYWVQVFLSSIIAALGLLQNSVAVVIGAMLIAPLLRPINGVSFSISKGEKFLFLYSLKILFLSIFISIFMGYLSAKIIGFSVETAEILSRVSPNILDLFIAIFSAVVAILSLGYKKMGLESVAGVAMAASLMPPLEVVGIELSVGNYYFAYGAAMLFLANLVSIILVGIIIFWLYGFTPNSGDKQKTSFETFTFIVLIMVII
ncbi:MAG: TIGR00341 family protein, partial [Candidatus Gracilibacteria bacterium]|nr:TIGR00341 family protein [Candidatus Gracilibacteria bacterium]